MDKEIEREFEMVRSEFSEYRTALDKKLDDLFDEIKKPMFNNYQILGVIGATILYTFYISTAFTKVEEKGDSLQRNADKQELEIKEDRKATSDKIDKIYEVVVNIGTDVAILKEKKTEYNRKVAIENNKQIIRDWVNK